MPNYQIPALTSSQWRVLVNRRLTTGEAAYMRRFLVRVGLLPRLNSRKAERWLAARIFDEYFFVYQDRFTTEKSKTAYLKEGYFVRVQLAHAALARLGSIRMVTVLYRLSRTPYTCLVKQGGIYHSQPDYAEAMLAQIGSRVIYDVTTVVINPINFDNGSEADDFDGPATMHSIPPMPLTKKRADADSDAESIAASEHDSRLDRRSFPRAKKLKATNYAEGGNTDDDDEDDDSETDANASTNTEKAPIGMALVDNVDPAVPNVNNGVDSTTTTNGAPTVAGNNISGLPLDAEQTNDKVAKNATADNVPATPIVKNDNVAAQSMAFFRFFF